MDDEALLRNDRTPAVAAAIASLTQTRGAPVASATRGQATGVNIGWSRHLADVELAELTTEVCDGRPSDIEREGVAFGGGRFCPWTARVVAIEED